MCELPISLVAGLLTIVVFQVNGLLFEKGVTDNPIPLKLSFWTLKALQSIHSLPPPYTGEDGRGHE
jgi:hypothetical protein